MSEAFVYCWTDLGTNKLYVGVHKGTPDDGYVCSSEIMLEEHTKRPNDFSRQIIAFGSFPEMYVFEQAILKAADADKDPGYYNQALSTGPFYHLGPQTPEHIEKRAAALRGKTQTPEHIANNAAANRGKTRGTRTSEHRANNAASCSHDWCIDWPDGHEEAIRNLAAFCRAKSLDNGAMVSVSKGRRKHHKGFRCMKVEKDG